ncbi:hypothetical protein ACTA71_002396 [Dictyostelium dimigraforme]
MNSFIRSNNVLEFVFNNCLKDKSEVFSVSNFIYNNRLDENGIFFGNDNFPISFKIDNDKDFGLLHRDFYTPVVKLLPNIIDCDYNYKNFFKNFMEVYLPIERSIKQSRIGNIRIFKALFEGGYKYLFSKRSNPKGIFGQNELNNILKTALENDHLDLSLYLIKVCGISISTKDC